VVSDVIAGRYYLLERVGQGGAAEVYRAMDTRLGRVVAIKLLRETYAHDSSFTARFENEARAAARLSHPNIVDVYDYDSSDGRYFIAMEYVSGRNLKEAIVADAPFDAGQAVAVMGPILSGLGAAHEAGLVHRDMKPQNVLVGPDGVSKIADFGIAKAMGDAGMTEAGIAFGTPHYLAPEQARGDAVSPRTDLYAVGVMLYEMLSGRLPFEGENPMRVAYAHVFDEPRALLDVAPGVGAGLASVVGRAMAKDPQERYGTAEEMLRALDAAQPRAGYAPAVASTRQPVAVAGAGAPTVSMPVIRTSPARELGTSRAVTIAGPNRTTQYPRAARRGRRGLLWLVPVLLTGFLVGCLLLGSRLQGLNGSIAGFATSTPEISGVPAATGVPTASATIAPSPTSSPATATTPPTATATPLPAATAPRPSATAPKPTVFPTVIRRPVRPARFTATAFSGTVVRLHWERVPRATRYVLELSTDRKTWRATARLGGGESTYTDIGLADGVTYYYRLRAFDAAGQASRYAYARAATPKDAPTATPISTNTPTPIPTSTPTPVPTRTPTSIPTKTPTPRPTSTSTPQPTSTPTPQPTNTRPPRPTNTQTPRPTNTPRSGPTSTPTPRQTNIPRSRPTKLPTPEPPLPGAQPAIMTQAPA